LQGHQVRARVLIRPKEGILDPQGQTVERALPALGFEGASHVRIGRLVELEVDDPSQLPAMCEKLLSNPLIEDYEVQLLEGERGNGSDPAR
jgi:phosphoribosylformylglycinamidine synthase PurS subunit